MRPLAVVVVALGLGVACAQVNVDVVIGTARWAGIEELVRRAWSVSAAVLEAEAAVVRSQWNVSLEGRLAQALSVSGSAGVGGDVYGQAAPRAALSVSLDLMALAGQPDTGHGRALDARAAEARARVRTGVVEAALRLVVARAAAENAAQALETSEAAFRVAEARLEYGDVTAGAVLDARLAVSNAAVALLRANGEAVVALENLAALVGLDAAETAAVLGY